MENTTTTQLTVNDLANIHQLFDAAASRGAFRAAEMEQVGQIYNKLTAFLQNVAEQQRAEQQRLEAEQQAAAPQQPETPPEAQGEENA